MSLPDTHFTLALCLLSTEAQHAPTVEKLVELEQLVRRGRFADAWTLVRDAAGLGALLKDVVGFEEALRRAMFDALARTYVSAPEATVRPMLGVADSAAAWTAAQDALGLSVAGGEVVFPSNSENRPRTRRFEDSIKFSDIADAIAALSR
jgi:CSN8/PSMD8/EIF3K family